MNKIKTNINRPYGKKSIRNTMTYCTYCVHPDVTSEIFRTLPILISQQIPKIKLNHLDIL